MNIIIKTKNVELTEGLETVVREKMGKLEKFSKLLENDSFEIFVELSKETNHHRQGDIFMAEATIRLPQKSLMAKSHGEDLMKAVIEVTKEMEREIKKYKTKKIEAPRRKIRKASHKEVF